jgi:aarF domain-containing kinase
LPQATLDELTKLQDAVIPFDTKIAVKQIEAELGGPLGQFFTSISEEPVAAASLAQVYMATLNDGKDTRVAVKVQRPKILSTVSKDLTCCVGPRRYFRDWWKGLPLNKGRIMLAF